MPSFVSIASFAVLLAFGSAIDPRVTSARPARDLIDKRSNGCPGINPLGGSIPDHSYTDGQPGGCPDATNHEDPDNVCRSGFQVNGPYCAAYCEVRNYFDYGPEVPFTEFAPCRANQDCSFKSTKSITITKEFEFNAEFADFELKKRDGDDEVMYVAPRSLAKRAEETNPLLGALMSAFSFGASYKYTEVRTSSTDLTLSRPSNTMDKCGYWTFVPIIWTSCGTMTTMHGRLTNTGRFSNLNGVWNCDHILPPFKTVQNWCQTSPYLDSSGNAAGAIVFVLLDCATNLKLPKAQQDPIYQWDGVSDQQLT